MESLIWFLSDFRYFFYFSYISAKVGDDSITIIKQQLGVISNLRKAQGILQNAMTALGQSRENLVKNANAAMEAGGISDKQCPLCGAPYSDRDELDSKIKEETELLSEIARISVCIKRGNTRI